jgi:multiple sugar transport system substrate-binding protein
MKKFFVLAGILLLVTSFAVFAKGNQGAADGSREGKIQIRFAGIFQDPNTRESGGLTAGLKAAEFEKKFPNVDVNTAYFIADHDSYNQKLITMALSGSDEFDGVWISPADVGTLANGGVLMNIDQYVNNEKRFNLKDDSKWITAAFNQFVIYRNSYYAVPFQTDCRIAFYYKPICEPLGYKKGTYPKTVAEFVEFCKKVAGAGAGYLPWANSTLDIDIVYQWALSFFGDGGTFERFDERTQKWVANMDNEAGYRWIRTVRNVIQTMPGDYKTSLDGDIITSLLQSGKVANLWTGPWLWSYNLGNDAEKIRLWDSDFIPRGSAKSASTMGGWVIGINKNTSKEKADLVWEVFAAIATDPKVNAVASSLGLPFMREAYNHAEWASNQYTKESWTNFAKQLETAQPVATPPCEAGANIYAAIGTVWQEVVLNERLTVQEGARLMNNAIQGALNDFYGY